MLQGKFSNQYTSSKTRALMARYSIVGTAAELEQFKTNALAQRPDQQLDPRGIPYLHVGLSGTGSDGVKFNRRCLMTINLNLIQDRLTGAPRYIIDEGTERIVNHNKFIDKVEDQKAIIQAELEMGVRTLSGKAPVATPSVSQIEAPVVNETANLAAEIIAGAEQPAAESLAD